MLYISLDRVPGAALEGAATIPGISLSLLEQSIRTHHNHQIQ
jgi:hypothetical protein